MHRKNLPPPPPPLSRAHIHTQACGRSTSLFASWPKVATAGHFDVKEQILSLFGRQVDDGENSRKEFSCMNKFFCVAKTVNVKYNLFTFNIEKIFVKIIVIFRFVDFYYNLIFITSFCHVS